MQVSSTQRVLLSCKSFNSSAVSTMMQSGALAMLALATLSGSSTAQVVTTTQVQVVASNEMCAPLYGRCHGPDAANRHPCCSAQLNCVQKEEHYAQCLPADEAVPAGWMGNTMTFTSVSSDPSPSPLIGTPSMDDDAPEYADDDVDVDVEYDIMADEAYGATPSPAEEVAYPIIDDSEYEVYDVESAEDLLDTPVETPAPESGESSHTCAPLLGRCHGSDVTDRHACCSPEYECVLKNKFFGQCRSSVPEGWLGTIVTYGAMPQSATTNSSMSTSPTASASVDVTTASSGPTPEFTTSTSSKASARYSSGQTQCAATYKRCGGTCSGDICGGACCNDSDHCVRKTSEFAACRPKSRTVPANWIGTVIE